jgi:APA family basic amino acid/polyamine antiporter
LTQPPEPRDHAHPQSDTLTSTDDSPQLARRIGLFDATMIVMGGIIGSGIFINAYVVARQVHSPLLVLGAWAMGGLIALAGAFIYAELAARRPTVGGQYAYIREAFHPMPAFLYGWTLLLVVQTGGMAAVAVTFARYFTQLMHWPASDQTSAIIAIIALAALTLINCLGVRAGSNVQSALMVLKIVAILALIVCGLIVSGHGPVAPEQLSGLDPTDPWKPTPEYLQPTNNWQLLTAFGAALVPVLFSYGGWQTSCFIAGEVREPRKNLPRGLMIGVLGVIVLYMAVNYIYVSVLSVDTLALTKTPATEIMHIALGERGQTLIAMGIAISTLGFLSQGMLTAPRVYFAMADDGLFFKQVAWLHPKTRVPVIAIALQGALAIVIALSGTYAQILNYVVSVDSIFFGLAAACVFGLRRLDKQAGAATSFRIPGHPVTTILFIVVEWLVALNTIYSYPGDSAKGWAILLAGIPVYFFWRWRRTR